MCLGHPSAYTALSCGVCVGNEGWKALTRDEWVSRGPSCTMHAFERRRDRWGAAGGGSGFSQSAASTDASFYPSVVLARESEGRIRVLQMELEGAPRTCADAKFRRRSLVHGRPLLRRIGKARP